ncbi:SDR family oxidoreductase [Deinococcus pimensis]|uniref:SDR family oxidoreductase n=1 Tax=Deinococcus pimensis TaxID=309888 RepID=UPI0004AD9195|nr:SDR family oxidoreductase [Deinococcus pimensis]
MTDTGDRVVGTDLTGKVALVTGATGGIGRVTARELARAGATVVVIGRDSQRTEEVAWELGSVSASAGVPIKADLGVQREVREAAGRFRERFSRLDILVNNAGAVNVERSETRDGIETTWAVNHLAYFLLTTELMDVLRATPGARVVSVASDAHRMGRMNWDDLEGLRGYNGWAAYAQSKLANVLFARELARRLRGSGVTSNSVHPGLVASGFGRNNQGWFSRAWGLLTPMSKTEEQGARTSLHVATSPEVAGVTGRYFSDEREVAPGVRALDDGAAARLWRLSEEMTSLAASV